MLTVKIFNGCSLLFLTDKVHITAGGYTDRKGLRCMLKMST